MRNGPDRRDYVSDVRRAVVIGIVLTITRIIIEKSPNRRFGVGTSDDAVAIGIAHLSWQLPSHERREHGDKRDSAVREDRQHLGIERKPADYARGPCERQQRILGADAGLLAGLQRMRANGKQPRYQLTSEVHDAESSERQDGCGTND